MRRTEDIPDCAGGLASLLSVLIGHSGEFMGVGAPCKWVPGSGREGGGGYRNFDPKFFLISHFF
jgi:hypothetical protein